MIKPSLALGIFCLVLSLGQAAAPKTGTVTLKWLGHASFLAQGSGYALLLDPYGKEVGYPVKEVRADAVFVSHEHFDHNHVETAPGARVLRGLASNGNNWAVFRKRLASGVSLRTVGVYHDAQKGRERGLNSVAVLDISGIRVVHLGDLGHLLSPAEAKSIGRVDVLLVPVGGTYTIDGSQAQKVVQALSPRLVIPMHYKTRYTSLPLESVEAFLNGSPWPVKRLKTDTLVLVGSSLPAKTTVYVLEPLSTGQPFRL